MVHAAGMHRGEYEQTIISQACDLVEADSCEVKPLWLQEQICKRFLLSEEEGKNVQYRRNRTFGLS